ncbi:valine--tRNA ligase [Albimonas pacifica]|uniref:Valine--tRNA ligase n=1 Tax=Albimonas pacifica TaxID=1114924 RepID=A0A1I3JPD2_9RHOB|nr:valine--tRNA ligase [Albimonas pacifica]SFI62103.1 valyl-tRNA synthetase [Albimonas pacifica]
MPMDKTFDAASAEPEIYARWEEAGAFAAGANAKPGAESFSIVIPPPNVTGSLHIGHALNNTLQDILIRWKRMQGYDTLWQPGQDHAGIATQMVVERKLAAEGNAGRREMGREAFTAKIWEWKAESGSTILNQLRRLGASCDWSRNAFTMSGAPGAPEGEDGNFHDAVLKVFVELHRAGLIYRDKRLVNWDPHFETAISDLEVEQVEEKGHLWRFRYKLADGETYDHPMVREEIDGEPTLRPWTPDDDDPEAWEERDYIVVATTRPETMLGDTGVAVAADDVRYAGLIGKSVILPLVGRRIPIVADEHADPSKGTGAVKITPAHDFNDFEVGKRAGLPRINVMTSRAAITIEGNAEFLEGASPSPEVLALEGLDRFVARKAIVDLAEGQGWLDGIDDEQHVVPHGDRSKVPVEPWLTDQWFVDAKTLAKEALAAAHDGRTTFHPANWVKTYDHWMENIEPWCISRQLWWGHQIPVWYGPDGKIFCEMSEAEALAAARAHYEGEVELTRDPDVLDTWFSSGLWPQGTFGWPEQTPELARYYPTSVLITGFDIIFFWVARMMMMGLHFMKDGEGRPQAPFHDVYVHALVRDEKGKKMSKSLGNVIDPLDLIDEYGADAMRFTLASMAAMGRDIKLAVSRVAGYRNFATKLWNAARFAEMNGCKPVVGFDPAQVQAPVNRWIVGETVRIAATVDQALTDYRFNDAANALYGHVWGVVCDWYVEFAKPLLMGEDGPAKDETRATLAWAIDQCLKLLHPFMPYVTEALWGAIASRSKMLIHADWPALDAGLADPAADARVGRLVSLIEAIRSVRAEMNVPPSAKLALLLVDGDAELEAAIAEDLPLIERLARVEGFSRATEAPKGAATIPVTGGALALPLAGIVDGKAEKARLEKALSKVEKEAAGIEKKLSNPGFLSKAPDEVVEENRERLAEARAEAERLRVAAARAAELV